ncbi:uncharacterized protein LOC62_04G006591 [Vanrija pseudolonga]|uniref:BTB domain-containing protein n=1 Tax=Vanrija pseudolonga TaxID=143232 RepID=A0AAF0YAN0_9TREE|nr:hypothetical protein LOC62_04G006591 [Vanrija pseudolonga]
MAIQIVVAPENDFTQGGGLAYFSASDGTLFRFSLHALSFVSPRFKEMFEAAQAEATYDIIPMTNSTPEALRLLFILITDRNSDDEPAKDLQWPEDETLESLITTINMFQFKGIYTALLNRIDLSSPWNRPPPMKWFIFAKVAGQYTGATEALCAMRGYGLNATNMPLKLLSSRPPWIVKMMSGVDVLLDCLDEFWASHHAWQQMLGEFQFSLETDFQLEHDPEECGDLDCDACNQYYEGPDQFAVSEARANGVTEKVWAYLESEDPWLLGNIDAFVKPLNLSPVLSDNLTANLKLLTSHM